MTHRLARRTFLTQVGRTAVGVIVVGAAACSDDSPAGPTEDVAAEPTGPATAATPEPAEPVAGEPSEVAAEPTDSADPAEAAAGESSFERVDLGFVSAYVLVRGGEAMVVDTGVAGSEAAIEAILTEAGAGFADVGHVVLTHKHPDHAGSVDAVAAAAADATLYVGAGDLDAITAPRALTSVGNGDVVFGADVVETPGHTPGHISLFDPAAGILFAGDAINNVGELTGPNPDFSEDMPTAIASVAVLAALQPSRVFFGHGGPLEAAAGPLDALAASL